MQDATAVLEVDITGGETANYKVNIANDAIITNNGWSLVLVDFTISDGLSSAVDVAVRLNNAGKFDDFRLQPIDAPISASVI